MLTVTAPALVIEAILGRALDLAAYTLVLKATLALGEVVWILIASALARRLGSARPFLIAGLAYLVPSSFAIGALFGQIDAVGAALVMASLVALDDVKRSSGATAEPTARPTVRPTMHLVISVLATLLLKPLTWPMLLPIVIVAARDRAWLHRRALLVCTLLGALTIVIVDALVAWPLGHPSHVLHALTTPLSGHGELAVAGGASVWCFVTRSGTSSHVPLALGLELATIGQLLFLTCTAAIAFLTFRARAHVLEVTCLASALVGLAAAFFLPGAHERYPAFAVAPVLLAALASPRLASLRIVTLAAGVALGLYVIASIAWGAFEGPFAIVREPWLAAVSQPVLLVLGIAALTRSR